MRFSLTTAVLAASAGVMAQDMSICDKYTTALLKNNTGANQYALLNLLVNRVVIGNYSADMTNNINVPGILKKGEYMGQPVNLMPYFDGTLKSTNRNNMATQVNFLADGGATPLMQNPPKPANSTNSPQYFLLTHLYQFFGALLGCSQYGKDGFPSYMGNPSMEAAHRFMNLNATENGYFITQVGLAATSFGVTMDDVSKVAMALNSTFNYRCSAPAKVVGDQPELQAICQAPTCPLAQNNTCNAYPNNGSPPTPTPGPSKTSGTGAPGATNTGAASAISISTGAGFLGLLAAMLL